MSLLKLFFLVPLLFLSGALRADPVPPAVASAFIKQCLPIAREVETKTGVPASLLVVMASQDSSFGTAAKLKARNNYFGLVGRNKAGAWGELRQFRTIEEGFEAVAVVLQRKRYSPVLQVYAEVRARTGSQREATAEAITELCRLGWSPEPSYRPEIRRIMDSHREVLFGTQPAS